MLPVSIRVALVLLLVAAGAGRANAQSDPDECGPYVLTGTLLECSAAGSPQQQLRTGAFIAGSPPLGTMLAQALGIEVATAPVGSSSGGFVWTRSAESIAPRRTSPTYGPAFSERALTIGRHNLSAGFNFLHRQYDRVDGIDLEHIAPFEFDGGSLAVSSSTLQLDVETDTLAAFASYGLLDSLDVGILVPWVQVSVRGRSSIFGQVDEELQRVNLGASADGIGDLAFFGKYRFWPRTIEPPNLDATVRQAGVALAVTARVPTGNEDELRGLGRGRVLISGVASATIHRFSPHVNVGYEFWTSGIDTPQDFQGNTLLSIKDQVLYSGGVEFEQGARLTLLFDVLGRYQKGGGQVGYQDFQFPANRTNVAGAQALVAVPGGFNTVLLAPGLKWNVHGQLLVTANVLITATDGGLTDRVTPVIGMDLGFGN